MRLRARQGALRDLRRRRPRRPSHPRAQALGGRRLSPRQRRLPLRRAPHGGGAHRALVRAGARGGRDCRSRSPPDYLPLDERYDKWGIPILADGQRLRGELFFDKGAAVHAAPRARALHQPGEAAPHLAPAVEPEHRRRRLRAREPGRLRRRRGGGHREDGRARHHDDARPRLREIDRRGQRPGDVEDQGAPRDFAQHIPEDWRLAARTCRSSTRLLTGTCARSSTCSRRGDERNMPHSWDETLQELATILDPSPSPSCTAAPGLPDEIRALARSHRAEGVSARRLRRPRTRAFSAGRDAPGDRQVRPRAPQRDGGSEEANRSRRKPARAGAARVTSAANRRWRDFCCRIRSRIVRSQLTG